MSSACVRRQKYVLQFFPWCGLFIIIIALVLISAVMERERKRTRGRIFFWKPRWKRRGTEHFPTILWFCFDLDKYGVKQEPFNWCLPFYGSVYVQVCEGMCCVYVACAVCHTHLLCARSLLSWCTILERNAPVSCMDLFFNPGRWRHICQSGCEDRIYCLMASAQDEDCEDDGTQGRPALPEGTFAAARKEEGAPRVAITTDGCRTRRDSAREASYQEKLQKWCVWNWFKLQMIQVLPPWTDRRC